MQALHETEGRLVENIVHFVRALRKAGLKVGTSQVKSAISAVAAAGFTQREDYYYALRATLVSRPEHLEVFHQVFQMFWRDPEFLERMVRSMLPLMQVMAQEENSPKAAQKRAAEALWDGASEPQDQPEREEIEVDAQLSWSQNEVLRNQDFEQMSVDEQAEAAKLIRTLSLPVSPLMTRRFKPSKIGRRPDTRAVLRRSLRKGGEIDQLSLKVPKHRPPNLVAICDISGSMSSYSRMMMHFLHALKWSPTSDWGQVHGFTFGTRLTNVSRALAHRDVDQALEALGRHAPDWQGGTRIGEALFRFNRDWSRRVLGQGAVVLLITDGLERGETDLLRAEATRLARSCHRLVWLNPLLRYDEFSPKAAGIRTLLPIVDSFHGCHSLNSLADLGEAFATSGDKKRYQDLLQVH
ncbi:VWA domain-containing protein [Aliiroseovarius sp. F20344]|uniref:vWA domain-containing protein n=1 Tax=Aliiroseovarius sp. F20344 TaxID=2926414 RepID=UPI001FF542DE|nr:VWA domain-containing protein [Aliiroseovarius sp. F20344]MCK0141986.1 VWA domain-containing protein [Aliiroseovarius sp. F20344]